jgi:hypothetical protein
MCFPDASCGAHSCLSPLIYTVNFGADSLTYNQQVMHYLGHAQCCPFNIAWLLLPCAQASTHKGPFRSKMSPDQKGHENRHGM